MVSYSILLPTHNRDDVLPYAIRSILAQTEQDFEVLIVGDGCTDNTAEVVQSFHDTRLRWFDLPKAPNFGYANRNIALRQAQGKYIAILGHDDLLLPDHLALVRQALETHQAEWIYSQPLWVNPEGHLIPDFQTLHDPATFDQFMTQGNFIPAACVMYDRKCHEHYGYWDEDVKEDGDWALWRKIIEGGQRRNFAYLPVPTCLHFKANWRNQTNFGTVVVHLWQYILAQPQLIPLSLYLPPAPSISQQQQFWELINTDPITWTKGIRDAVEHLGRTLAALYVDQRLHVIHLEAQSVQQQALLADLDGQIADLHHQIANLHWRRQLRYLVFPLGTRRERWWVWFRTGVWLE